MSFHGGLIGVLLVAAMFMLLSGGLMLGAVFMATDPVSAAMTDVGRWIYGFFIGVICIVIRVANPAYPEGVMLSILFMNLFSPLLDQLVLKSRMKKRIPNV